MTYTPHKNIPLTRLRAIQADNGISASGKEYAPDELESEIHAKQARAADFDFAAVSVRRAVLDRKRRGKRQGTRLLKTECVACGYVARVTSKWIGAVGAPVCPCSMQKMRVL